MRDHLLYGEYRQSRRKGPQEIALARSASTPSRSCPEERYCPVALGPVNSARVAYARVLRPQNPSSARENVGDGHSLGNGVEAQLRRRDSPGQTHPAPEALGGVGGTG
jgi:hypothetical protein